mmetsp:Transcript_24303/g.68080  ORF Transcript_24303/g.68080 Transcript_24303/m.68080 type:complete len:215 (+) Transcript_24303:3389-4033(+)
MGNRSQDGDRDPRTPHGVCRGRHLRGEARREQRPARPPAGGEARSERDHGEVAGKADGHNHASPREEQKPTDVHVLQAPSGRVPNRHRGPRPRAHTTIPPARQADGDGEEENPRVDKERRDRTRGPTRQVELTPARGGENLRRSNKRRRHKTVPRLPSAKQPDQEGTGDGTPDIRDIQQAGRVRTGVRARLDGLLPPHPDQGGGPTENCIHHRG